MARKRTTTFRLPGRLDASAASGLREALIARRGKGLALVADDVVFIGALSAQVLVAAANTWRGDGLELTVKSASEAFAEGLRLLGLTPDLIESRN